jgi:hypothetical protein
MGSPGDSYVWPPEEGAEGGRGNDHDEEERSF